jgi:hypothetical protein
LDSSPCHSALSPNPSLSNKLSPARSVWLSAIGPCLKDQYDGRTCVWRICPTRTSSSSFPSTCGSDRRANTSHSTRTSPNASRCGGTLLP